MYPLLDLDTCRRRGLKPQALLQSWRGTGVVSYYQWRAKGVSTGEYLQQARELRSLAPTMPIFANDHAAPFLGGQPGSVAVTEALDLFAGLHLGQEDLAALSRNERARLVELRRSRPGFVLGLSTHSADQLAAALRFDQDSGFADIPTAKHRERSPIWSYLALGPCFPTGSKPTGRDPVLSPAEFHQAIETLVHGLNALDLPEPFPLVLIGGIQSTNIEELLQRFAQVEGHRRVQPVVAGIEWTLDGTHISELAGKIQTYSS